MDRTQCSRAADKLVKNKGKKAVAKTRKAADATTYKTRARKQLLRQRLRQRLRRKERGGSLALTA